MKNLYAQDGVDVLEGDNFSSFAAQLCEATKNNSPFVRVHDLSRGHFRGPRGIELHDLPQGYLLEFAPDGIGTKVVIITEALSHITAARDVMAMTAMDITRWGGCPLIFINVLDVATIGKAGDKTNESFRQVLRGLLLVARDQGMVLYKGETAELGDCVGSENPKALTKYNWAGFASGVYDLKRLITGDTVEPGMVVIALREYGFRSNGISSVRSALKRKFSKRRWNLRKRHWWDNPAAQDAIKAAAEPSVMYDKFLTHMNGWYSPDFKQEYRMHLIAHITGGGIKSKFAEDILFPRGLSATLDNLWEPPEIMRQCAEWRGMPDEEIYSVLNGGQGALVVVERHDANPFVQSAERYGIEAKICGKITKNATPTVTIASRFSNRVVEYHL